ncbi:MAG TPA: antitoxin VbhA family protein [Candidatus Limnocylindrales bacterium]|nr:antitoxin VbhA family protein [Candidatus Limnocylindrales bacterium]
MSDILTVRQTLEQLSTLLERFRKGNAGPVAIGSRRHREAVIVPAALWDSLVGERRRSTGLTDASLRLEGLARSDAARRISDRYVDGEIDVDEMVRQTIALHTQADGA